MFYVIRHTRMGVPYDSSAMVIAYCIICIASALTYILITEINVSNLKP